jgi:cbb3-type cytochrome oxidase maturation protein
MMALAWLIPAALFLGLLGLAAFLWALRSGQFEDLEGASWRAIADSERPGPPRARSGGEGEGSSERSA